MNIKNFKVGDMVYIRDYGFRENEGSAEMKDGIYDVIIVTEDGTELDAVMYFWTIPGLRYDDKDLRGLVCLKDDTEAIEDAKKKFEEKVVWL